ncbi:MAG TPA: UTP--glucose-1-phosphate uridylyltransferase [Polyangiaceae bacterium]|nr:UTP--glucose-1-phosphate uridylyltransferase [Polyangiaceae bacterium]
MVSSIQQELARLPADVSELLRRHRFDPQRFEQLAAKLTQAGASDNRVKGRVEAPSGDDVTEFPARGSAAWNELERLGLDLLARGECALVVLAGGMATRMGGVVKALVDALPGETFLDLRLKEIDAMQRRVGRAPPFWLMSSHSTHEKLVSTLGPRLDGYQVAVFPQYLSIRLTPDGHIFTDAQGRPSEHAPGHGDLPDALRDSGLIGRFVKAGGKLVMVANLDNLGATLEPAVIGWHLKYGRQVTCEVVSKVGSDRGGIPARVDGRLVVLEEFRLPDNFDAASVRVFNTNTFQFDARALLELDMAWTYFIVQKKIGDAPVIQFERLVNEVTSHLAARFILVPRSGSESRFLPVKDNEELEARRSEIRAVAEGRGILP